ncbi:hypothetical protein ACHAQJ_009775 [Trichoderma viride]
MSNKKSSSVATLSAISNSINSTATTTANTIDTTVSNALKSAVTNVNTELMKPGNHGKSALSMVATAATALREAIISSLPVSSTQLMTVQVPGTIIDLTPNEDTLKPLGVQIAEAKLVDNQIPISKVMTSRTSKSVSRSYLAALDCLVSAETSVSSYVDDRALTDCQAEIRDRYTQAMSYLTMSDDGVPGKSRLQTYVEKQESWNQAIERYNEAQFRHRQADQEKGLTPEQQKYSFLEWLQLSGRDYKAAIQAKYMDWVVHGNKFTVEFNFGVVDITSAMKRIESSKEAFRNLTLLAADGATEFSSVNLTPPNWAKLVQEKMDEWIMSNNSPSTVEIHEEIRRLRHILISHQGLYDAVDSGKFVPHQFNESEDDASKALRDHYKQAYADANANKWANEQISAVGDGRMLVGGDKTSTRDDKVPVGEDKTSLRKEDKAPPKLGDNNEVDVDPFKDAFDTVAAEAHIWNKAFIAQNKVVMRATDDASKEETKNYIIQRIDIVKEQIERLESKMNSMNSELVPAPHTIVKPQIYANGKSIDDHELIANRDLLEDSMAKEPSPWIRIITKVAASEFDSVKATSDSSINGGLGGGWGFWSVGASGSHISSKEEEFSSMADLEVQVSMDCMLVEIDRPWLNAELFADNELDAAPGFTISPGHIALQQAAEQDSPLETEYTQFCSYPNAFVIACNVELEFNGNTASLESSLGTSATEANTKVGWGPFTLASYSHKGAKSSSKTRIKSTATGLRISLQAPQIIAWVQELLPALPKRTEDNPASFEIPLAEFSV